MTSLFRQRIPHHKRRTALTGPSTSRNGIDLKLGQPATRAAQDGQAMCSQPMKESEVPTATAIRAVPKLLPAPWLKNRTFRHTRVSLVALAVIALAAVNPCQAIDPQPGDWETYPATNVFMGFTEFSTSSKLDNTIVGNVPDSHVDSEIGIARFMHFGQIAGHTFGLQAILPFGSLNNAKINGQDLSDASGVSDPILAAGYWFVEDTTQKTWFSFVNFVTVPVGSYDRNRALNLGGNHWQNDIQFDVTKGFLDKWTIDVSVDWIHAWDNTEAGTGHQTLRQKEKFGNYVWLTYDLTPRSSLSVGYAGTYGGAQSLDGVRTGAEAGEQQIRMTYSQFITPSMQGLISVSHDVSATGQFKQDVGVLLRVAKLF
jgi:hypothetical protein